MWREFNPFLSPLQKYGSCEASAGLSTQKAFHPCFSVVHRTEQKYFYFNRTSCLLRLRTSLCFTCTTCVNATWSRSLCFKSIFLALFCMFKHSNCMNKSSINIKRYMKQLLLLCENVTVAFPTDMGLLGPMQTLYYYIYMWLANGCDKDM